MATLEVPDELLDDMLDALEWLEEDASDVPQPVLPQMPPVLFLPADIQSGVRVGITFLGMVAATQVTFWVTHSAWFMPAGLAAGLAGCVWDWWEIRR